MSQPASNLSDTSIKPIGRRAPDWSLVAAFLLLAAMLSPLLVGRIYLLNDLGEFHLPLRAFYAEQLARREPFLWSPQLFCGYYVAGEGQAGMFHPWHWLLYSAFPLSLAFAVEVIGSYPFMFAGMYLLLCRRLQRRDAATFGSLLLTFSSFNLMHFIHVNAIAVVAHVPWLLLALDVMMLDADRQHVAIGQLGVALLTGSQLLLGYPQYVWFSLLAETAYLCYLAMDRADLTQRHGIARRPAVQTGIRWALAKTAGALLGAVQILPTFDVLNESVRQSVDAAYTSWGSLHPLNLLQLVAPYLYITHVFGRNTYELGMYLGAVPLMLLVWVWIERRRLRGMRRLAAACALFGAIALWLALGKYGGIYGLQRWLPIVGGFRCPCRYLVLFDFCAAVLCAVGLTLLLCRQERQHKMPWRQLAPLAIPAAASVAAACLPWLFPSLPFFGSPRAVWLGPILIGAAGLLVALAARGARWAVPALILFAAFDLGVYGLSYTVLRDTENIYRFISRLPVPQQRPEGRVLMNPEPVGERGVHFGNAILLAGWSRADGYCGLEPARRLDYRQLPALRVAGVRWVMRNELTSKLPGLIDQGDWMQVPDPLPRVRLLTHTRQSHDPARDLATTPVHTTALTESPVRLPSGPPGIATLYCDRPGWLEVWVNAPTPQLLAVSERYHAGWHAQVDGHPRPVLRVNGDFMGCVVLPGERRVQLTFRPDSLRYGMVVSLLGLALVAILLLPSALRHHLNRP